ncbi:MAG TPA: hypothetical protein VEY09_08175 [Pyrinomonadaceae bacterium]|nr:hypothetical protein [Pyrinomonadaceae bacterium]
MRKRFSAISLLGAAFALALAASASPAQAQNTRDFAHGNGTIEFEGKVSNFSFTAQRHKDGSVKGTLIYHQRSATNPENNLSVHMRIDCLTVAGSVATIQGIITKADPESVFVPGFGDFSLVGAAASMTVNDAGEGNPDGDMASFLYITGARSNFCAIAFPPEMYRTTNVIVRSAQP